MDNKTLIEILVKRLDKDKSFVESTIDTFASIAKEKLCAMDSIAIPGFGSFESKKRMERISVNPSTGKRMLVPPKITVAFKPSVLLKQKMKVKAEQT